MTDEKILNRLKYRFDLLDANGNGYLQAEDFEVLAERVIAAFGTATPQAQEAVRAGHRRYWEGLLGALDADADQQVSFAEYASGLHSAEPIGAYADAVAAIADVDGDGFIEKADFVACMRAIGFRDGIEGVFTDLDTDNDSRVTPREWSAAIREFYLSDAADARGHQLAGI
ncbi:EF-hand domain-containing protein [Phytomonospora endophytica]|uniref:Ca2+-binding EF-hand superfamily protein n=1 Tax=Phytomonospora endophytica TaxID=714109 RepID=A0A841FX31_9ACTN|nr:EF-hand domain-containing protein [Phytomonospora endophytica]MBB6037907.1 Ca2+-binding EF-hand superfamily protein [Phytomonospora endophytica]GIG68807.1 calcium-binding protein [Phytomonospora endophytica]